MNEILQVMQALTDKLQKLMETIPYEKDSKLGGKRITCKNKKMSGEKKGKITTVERGCL